MRRLYSFFKTRNSRNNSTRQKSIHCTLKPKCVIEYDKEMVRINRQNQMLACFPMIRKSMKGY